jgi:uncharacterized protein Usg
MNHDDENQISQDDENQINLSDEDRYAATKEGFLNFPKDQFCTSILSLGPPACGKTFVMMECVKYWLSVNMFQEYYLVLPNFKNEMSGSYDWLKPHANVKVYQSWKENDMKKLLEIADKEAEDFKNRKIAERPRRFFAIDDATSQNEDIFKSKTLLSFICQHRHYFIHSFIACHYDKGVIGKKCRNNIYYMFFYPVKPELLQNCYKDYIDMDEFPTFDDFYKFWRERVRSKKYGSLLVTKYGKGAVNSTVRNWFK